nr:MAG TPA: hypothetical protein [Caudoviricetes sp.]
MNKIEKTIKVITEIEKDELTTDEKKYYVIRLLNELRNELGEFDKINIRVFINILINDKNELQFGVSCFHIKQYLNEIKGWYY